MQTKIDYAANIALYLLERTGSVLGEWGGHISKKDQINLIGVYLGKGTIVINGANETVCNRVKVCFGHDYDDRNVKAWRDL